MDFFTTLTQEQAMILADLDLFIQEYDTREDNERLAHSSVIFDRVRLNLRKKMNLLYPLFETDETINPEIRCAAEGYGRVDDILESLVLIHVDEPNHRYYDRMVELREVLQGNYGLEDETIMPHLRRVIRPETLAELERQTVATQSVDTMATQPLVQPIAANR